MSVKDWSDIAVNCFIAFIIFRVWRLVEKDKKIEWAAKQGVGTKTPGV